MPEEEIDMAVQMIGTGELVYQLLDDAGFLGRELVGVFGVDGGEVARYERMGLVSDGDRARFEVDLVEEEPVFPCRIQGDDR